MQYINNVKFKSLFVILGSTYQVSATKLKDPTVCNLRTAMTNSSGYTKQFKEFKTLVRNQNGSLIDIKSEDTLIDIIIKTESYPDEFSKFIKEGKRMMEVNKSKDLLYRVLLMNSYFNLYENSDKSISCEAFNKYFVDKELLKKVLNEEFFNFNQEFFDKHGIDLNKNISVSGIITSLSLKSIAVQSDNKQPGLMDIDVSLAPTDKAEQIVKSTEQPLERGQTESNIVTYKAEQIVQYTEQPLERDQTTASNIATIQAERIVKTLDNQELIEEYIFNILRQQDKSFHDAMIIQLGLNDYDDNCKLRNYLQDLDKEVQNTEEDVASIPVDASDNEELIDSNKVQTLQETKANNTESSKKAETSKNTKEESDNSKKNLSRKTKIIAGVFLLILACLIVLLIITLRK